MSIIHFAIATSAAITVAAAPPARASIILAPLQASGSIMLNGGSVVTPNPGNDNVPGLSTNLLDFDLTVNALTGGDASFNGGTGPATEYTVTTKVTNNTGVTWVGYTLSLAGGTRAAPTLQSVYIYDFDLAPPLTGSAGSWASPNNNIINWTGLNVPHGQSITLVCNIDLPVLGAGGWRFDQYPTQVPGPGAAMTALLAGLLGIRRCR